MSNTVDFTSILVQVPLVAAFIWFALQLNKSHNTAMDKILTDNRTAIDKIIADSRASNVSVMRDWREVLKQRDEQWQSFLREQRTSTNEAIDTLAERLAEISRIVAELDRDVRGPHGGVGQRNT